MSRSIRPIGPVTATLRKAGYNQYAAIIVDGEQLPNVSVLTVREGQTVKFVGAYLDSNGEMHTTNKCMDMKRAARRILTIREHILDEQDDNLDVIDCPGCGKRHSDLTLCPED